MTASPFWVVEKYLLGTLHYWTPLKREWSPDIDFAAKFFDQQSAEMALANPCKGEGRTVQHQYMETAAPDLLAAAKTVLAGLNARIDAAPSNAVPLFDGIADLHDAIAKAEGRS